MYIITIIHIIYHIIYYIMSATLDSDNSFRSRGSPATLELGRPLCRPIKMPSVGLLAQKR